MKSYRDIVYRKTDIRDLLLDIYVPEVENPPLIMWIHGGGWKDNNKEWNLILPQLERGYAVASVDYRYADEEPFPGMMIDLKAGMRYLKEHADEYGYNAEKMIVSGDSAGGHLAILMAVSAGNKDWEDDDFDYHFQAAVDFVGPCRMLPPQDRENAPEKNVMGLLAGVSVKDKTFESRMATARPLNFIDGSEPPFLILHGTNDEFVDPIEARTLRNALEAAGVPTHMYYVPGGNHGLSGKLVDDIIQEFLDYYIKGQRTVITPDLTEKHMRTAPKTERYF